MADSELYHLYLGILIFLTIASLIGAVIKWKVKDPKKENTVKNLNDRIKAWWVMVGVFMVANVAGLTATVLLFLGLSVVALKEFTSLIPSKAGDLKAQQLAFMVLTPLQYLLIWIEWYGMFALLIPVYAFLFIPTLNAAQGDPERFLARTAKLQWGLMISVYCVSHAPALLTLNIPGYEGENAKLLLYMVLVVQLSDVLQYVWGKTTGKRAVAPTISPNKTVEGFVGGVLSASLVGTALSFATPFSPLQAWMMALLIALAGFAGGLTMSAIKRDAGVKDFGTLIEGHGGVLDRIDSICFAAPLFFHVVRYFFTA
ncbi:MAG TPA: phosphatidate cytidylyltransferase [Phycisphaerales bacterium]|nr:phosphatidate cytidylyltransferase [Phycisphaerales bacterium]